jgi:hypothetical protein
MIRHRDADSLTEAPPLVDEGHDRRRATQLPRAQVFRSGSVHVRTVRAPAVAPTDPQADSYYSGRHG